MTPRLTAEQKRANYAKRVRPIRVADGVAYVPLTQGLETIIDEADIPLAQGRNWYAIRSLNTFYAVANCRASGKHRQLRLHRVILSVADDVDVDHVDLNGLNNRRSNLRPATAAENMRNTRKRANNTSGFKGVRWNKRDRRWVAQITVMGQVLYLGQFKALEDARAAYAEASKRLHGEFGRPY